MRKYSAIFALILTLWGVFSPFGISMTLNPETGSPADSNSLLSVGTESNVAYATVITSPGQTGTGTSSTAADDAVEQTPEEIEKKGGNLDCGLTDVFCGFFKLIITFILFIPNAVTTVTGLLMDFSIWLGINPVMYGSSGGILSLGDTITSTLRDAWGIIRDFSNILFIFALFVIAFSLILNKNLMNFEPKKAIVKVIIMALLVNFSFLFCRLVIQTADIFSNMLYSKIENTSTGGSTGSAGIGSLSASSFFAGGLGIKSPSLSLVSKANPQSLLVTDNKGQYQTDGAVGFIRSFGGLLDVKGWEFYVAYGTIAVFAWLMNLILTFVFCSIIFLFLGRIFGLWIAVIISPLAFVSYAIPSLEDNKHFGFKNWSNNLFQLAFMAPIFMFFLYISVVVLNINDKLVSTIGGDGLVASVMKGLVPLFGASFILLKGKKIAYDMSGEIGAVVSKVAGVATTAALGAATGGTALALRQTLGRAGAGMANGFANDNSMLGRGMRSMGSRLGAASFDVRQSSRVVDGLNRFTGAAGSPIDLGNTGLRTGGFTAEGTIGEQIRKQQEEAAKRAEEAAIAAAEAAKLNAQAAVAQELRLNESKLELAEKAKQAEDARIAMEAENQGRDVFMELKRMELEEKEGELSELLADATRLSDEHDALETEKTALETERDNLLAEATTLSDEHDTLETEKTALETQLAAIPTGTGSVADREERARLTTEIAAKETEITAKTAAIAAKETTVAAKETEITAKTAALAANVTAMTKKEEEVEKKEEDIAKVAAVATTLTTLDVQSVRDARQKKVDLELEATHSLEKEEMDQWKATMEEKNTKRGEEQKKLNALKTKLKNATTDAKKAEIQAEIDEVQKDVDKKDKEYTDAKKTHKTAKKAYDDAFGNKIKALEDFEKDTIEIYQNSSDVIERKTIARNAVITAQKAVNASKNNVDNINYELQQKYADDLETNNPQGGWRGVVGTATGGAMFGGSVRNAAENGATKVRQNITGNTGGKK